MSYVTLCEIYLKYLKETSIHNNFSYRQIRNDTVKILN